MVKRYLPESEGCLFGIAGEGRECDMLAGDLAVGSDDDEGAGRLLRNGSVTTRDLGLDVVRLPVVGVFSFGDDELWPQLIEAIVECLFSNICSEVCDDGANRGGSQ